MTADGMVRAIVTLGLLASTIACEADRPAGRPLWDGPQPPGERMIDDVDWVQEWQIGADDDPVLAHPRHLTPTDSLIVWWDDYDHRVLAAGLDGTPRWTFGRRGAGPDEFTSVGDVAVDAAGLLWVLDSDNGRITKLSPDGRRVGLITLPQGFWRGLAPRPDGTVIVSGADGARPFALVDTTGAVEQRFGPPWDGFEGLALLQRQGRIIHAPDGRWVFAFSLANGWFPFEGVEPAGHIGRSIEHSALPEVIGVGSRSQRVSRLVTRPNCSTCSGWIDGDTLNLLFGGETESANRVVDQYRWSDGVYLRSLRLPSPALEAVAAGDLIILRTVAMEPEITAYSSRAAPARNPMEESDGGT